MDTQCGPPFGSAVACTHSRLSRLPPQKRRAKFKDSNGGRDPTQEELTNADIKAIMVVREVSPGNFVEVPVYPRGYIVEVLGADRDLMAKRLSDALTAQEAARERFTAATAALTAVWWRQRAAGALCVRALDAPTCDFVRAAMHVRDACERAAPRAGK